MANGEDVLGPEWGNLAGYSAEEALKYVSQYAADLEDQLGRDGGDDSPSAPSQSGGEGEGSSPDDSEEGPDALDKARQMNQASKAPLGAEFVGQREAARRQARNQIEQVGYDWDSISDQVETVMSNVPAQQQTNPDAWVEAFVYVWGRTDVQRRVQQAQSGDGGEQGGQATPSPPRSEPSEGLETTDVRSGPMTADRGKRGTVSDRESRPEIDDPIERNTKQNFEKILGRRISDEEWVRLRDESVNTMDDYNRLQDELEN